MTAIKGKTPTAVTVSVSHFCSDLSRQKKDVTTMLPENSKNVKHIFDTPRRGQKYASPKNKLQLCSGSKVKPKRHGNQPAPQPPRPVLTISKHISLALTLDKYGVQYNAETVRRIGGKK